jgi:glucosamine-phosphate N-acetyltransferase
MTNLFKIRPLAINDYDKGYLNLLSQLTTVGEINKDKYEENFNKLPECHKLFVIEDITKNTIVSIGSLIIETKFIHNCGKVGHIEDIVVDRNWRGKGLGKMMINYLSKLSDELKCYKCILNCSNDLIEFYKKCNFNNSGYEMSLYH